MTDTRTHQDSIVIAATPEEVYDLVSDIARTGEWSPVCVGCSWDDEEAAGTVGAWFTGRNEQPGRTWETHSQVVAADRSREFAWVVGGSFVRWGYALEPVDAGTRLTESWEFLPDGLAMFRDKYGDTAQDEIDARTEAALTGIPATLAEIRRIAEASPTRVE